MAERLPGLTDPNAPAPVPAQPGQPQPTPVTPPTPKLLPAVHPDRFSPGIAPQPPTDKPDQDQSAPDKPTSEAPKKPAQKTAPRTPTHPQRNP
jgi:rod shape-determining protein MreC